MKSALKGDLKEKNMDIISSEEKVLRLVSKIESNGFGVWKDDICMGRGLYLFILFILFIFIGSIYIYLYLFYLYLLIFVYLLTVIFSALSFCEVFYCLLCALNIFYIHLFICTVFSIIRVAPIVLLNKRKVHCTFVLPVTLRKVIKLIN